MKILLLLGAFSCLSFGRPAPKTIGLLFFNDCEKGTQAQMVKEISEFYHCKVVILPPTNLPAFAYRKDRNRYRADSILKFMAPRYTGYSSVLAFTNRDISCTSRGVEDWGVFGLGSPTSGMSVASTNRLNKGTPEQIQNKILNTALHEIGHTFKLEHCTNKKCLMQDAEGKLPPSDLLTPWMCEHCKGQIAGH
jgi:archaemetzincin